MKRMTRAVTMDQSGTFYELLVPGPAKEVQIGFTPTMPVTGEVRNEDVTYRVDREKSGTDKGDPIPMLLDDLDNLDGSRDPIRAIVIVITAAEYAGTIEIYWEPVE